MLNLNCETGSGQGRDRGSVVNGAEKNTTGITKNDLPRNGGTSAGGSKAGGSNIAGNKTEDRMFTAGKVAADQMPVSLEPNGREDDGNIGANLGATPT